MSLIKGRPQGTQTNSSSSPFGLRLRLSGIDDVTTKDNIAFVLIIKKIVSQIILSLKVNNLF